MKSHSGICALSALMFLALGGGTVQAEGVFSGTVRRVDEQTFRIQFYAYWVLAASPCLTDPPRSDAYPYCTFLTNFWLHGPFGLARNTDLYVEENGVVSSGIPSTSLSSQFDFDAPATGSSRLILSWQIAGDYLCQWCWPESCDGPFHQLCASGEGLGEVYAVLPTRIGDSAPLEPVVAVDGTNWGQVKLLYR